MQKVSSVPVTKGKFCACFNIPVSVIDEQGRQCGVFGLLLLCLAAAVGGCCSLKDVKRILSLWII